MKEDEIRNLAIGVIKDYFLEEEEEEKHFKILKEIFKKHGNQPFHIFCYLSFIKNFLILSKVNKYTIEVPLYKEKYFLNRLKNECFIQVENRRVDNDKILLTISIFR